MAALAAADPEATDRVLVASLPPLVASSLTERRRSFVDPVYGFDTILDGYSLGECPREDLAVARELVAHTLLPAAQNIIVSELARMRMMTKARPEAEGDLRLLGAGFAEEIRKYPSDVIRGACRKWSRTEKWWPSLAELTALLDRAVARRKFLEEAMARR